MTFRVINSSTLLPQHRQRLYFVGFRQHLKTQFQAFRCVHCLLSTLAWNSWRRCAHALRMQSNRLLGCGAFRVLWAGMSLVAGSWPALPLLPRQVQEILEGEDSTERHQLSPHQWDKIQASPVFKVPSVAFSQPLCCRWHRQRMHRRH